MSTTLKSREMFIDGKWVPGTGREHQDIVNPATGKVIASVPKGTEEDVNLAVRAARDAYDDVWFDSTPRDRSERLLKLAEVITLHGEELAQIESENVGKPLAPTISEEIPPIADCFRFFAGAARPSRSRAAPAKKRKQSAMGGISSEMVGASGLPTFSDSICASSSPCSVMTSASLSRRSLRSRGVLSNQTSSYASRAALTARLTSSSVPLGTDAMTLPVAGLTMSWCSRPVPGTHLPSMNISRLFRVVLIYYSLLELLRRPRQVPCRGCPALRAADRRGWSAASACGSRCGAPRSAAAEGPFRARYRGCARSRCRPGSWSCGRAPAPCPPLRRQLSRRRPGRARPASCACALR